MKKPAHPEALREMRRFARDVVTLLDIIGMSRAEFSRRLGWAPSQTTRFLQGKENATLSTLARVCEALDCRLVVQLRTE